MAPGFQSTLLPKGFLASGVNCGVRRYRPDLGLIMTETECVVAGVFTLNQCKGAPVTYCQALLPSGKIRALITNSGQANAATGDQGVKNNLAMVQAVAEQLGLSPNQVLSASTGVIGKQMDMERILPAIPQLVERATNVADGFALAILTTDLVPKTVTTVINLSAGEVRLTGICKGSGMIHPNMATMLGYLLTDLELTPEQAQAFLRESNELSFNMISVDGDSSTNDSSYLMASGASGVRLVTVDDEVKFQKALVEVSQFLAKAIAADGEGASKLLEVDLKGSPTLELARTAARSLTMSPLIKSAMHGEDPNWGRILSRLGAEQVPWALLAQMTLRLQGVLLFADGAPQPFDREAVHQLLKTNRVQIDIDLKGGAFSATAWGCDLSKKYVEINMEYS